MYRDYRNEGYGPEDCYPQEGDSKLIACEECGEEFYVTLKIGEKEFLDGYHGECPKPFCGYRYFERI